MVARQPTFVAVLVAVVAMACGSTVQVDGGAANVAAPTGLDATTAPDSLTGPGVVAQGSPPDLPVASTQGGSQDLPVANEQGSSPDPPVASEPTGTTAPGSTGGQPPQQPGNPVPGEPTPAGTDAAPGAAVAATYRGVTADTVTIGVLASRNTQQAAAAAGLSSVDPGDPVKQVEALVAHLNRNGGVAGRELAVEWHFRDDTSSDTTAAQYQAACEDFTHDKQVFGVLTAFGGGPMAHCLAERDHFLIETNGVQFFDTSVYQQLGDYYFTPGMMSLDHYAAALVDGVARQGYFDTTGAKFGLYYYDKPEEHRTIEQVVKPALARLGVTVTDEHAAMFPQSTSDTGPAQAETQNAVLRFKSRGVTHVLMPTLASPMFFGLAAEQAAYRPTYGVGTYGVPFLFADNFPQQAANSMAVGFMPAMDVHQADRDGDLSQRERLCRQIMNDAGMDTSQDVPWVAMVWHCDVFFFFDEIADRAADLTPSGLAAAAESIGESYESPVNFAVRITPRRHDGPVEMRRLVFHKDCGCFRYAGEPYRVD